MEAPVKPKSETGHKMKELTDNEIKKFFADHPAISIQAFEKEAGVPLRTLSYFLRDYNNFQLKRHRGKITALMYKYGFSPGDSQAHVAKAPSMEAPAKPKNKTKKSFTIL